MYVPIQSVTRDTAALTPFHLVCLLGYRVYQRPILDSTADSTLIYDGINDSATRSLGVKDLIANAGYMFTLLVFNQFNISSPETDNVIHIAKLEPSGPSGVDVYTASSVSGGSLQVSYSMVLDTGGFVAELVRYYAKVRFLSSCYNPATTACEACSATMFPDTSGVHRFDTPQGTCSPAPCSTGGICCFDSSKRVCGILAERTELCAPESAPICTVDGLTYLTTYAASMSAGNPIGSSSFSAEVFVTTRYSLLSIDCDYCFRYGCLA